MQQIRRKIAREYLQIGRFLRANKNLLIIVILAVVEAFVYCGINVQASDAYWLYSESTKPQYSNEFAFIFFENLEATLFTILPGLIPAFLGCLYMGFMTAHGLVGTFKFFLPDIPSHVMLPSLLPHGVFEMSVILFSIMLSCILSKEITLAIIWRFTKKRGMLFGRSVSAQGVRKTVWMTVKSWFLIVLPATLLAAVLEITVSSRILEWLL